LDGQVKAFREDDFGNADENHVVCGGGRDIVLNTAQSGNPPDFFVFPCADADGKIRNDDLAGWNLPYTISLLEE
jgi:hypothetical protein